MIHPRGQFHRVHGQFNVHVALDLTPAHAVRVFTGWLGDHGEAIVIQPVDQRPDGRIFVVFKKRCIIKRPKKLATAHKFLS